MQKKQFELTGIIKQNIHCEIWNPDRSPKFAMLLVHGLGEHCNRYLGDFSEFYNSHDAVIYTFDLPGHGQSGGKRGILSDHQDFNQILDRLLSRIKEDFPGLPIFIYGHSLGGLVSAKFVIENQPAITGVVLSAPALGVDSPLPPLKVVLVNLLDKVYPSLVLDNELDSSKLSRDVQVVEDYNNDPLVHGVASMRLGAFILNQGQKILANHHLLSVPTLIMVGEDDALVSINAIQDFCGNTKLCTSKVWNGLYHEIHNEKQNKDVFEFTLAWIKKQL